MKSLRVLIAEDHAVVREGTRQILERDPAIDVVGEADNGQQAIDLTKSLRPDILVLDLRLPVLSGIEAAKRITAECPETRILVLSAYDDEDYVAAAMEAGASGYLLKTAHGDEVVNAIHSISQGEVVLQSGIAAKLWKSRSQQSARERGDLELPTDREMEILRLAAKGLRNKEIARDLGLSVRTVEGHLSHLFSKLGVTSRTEAILMGGAHGWYSLGGKD